MKNTIKLMMCTLLALLFVGCTENPNGDVNRLAKPNFSANVTDNTILVSWSAVDGAAYYEIKLNEGSVEKTDKLVHKYENLEYDATYTISLRAVSANEQSIASSEFATQKATIAARKAPQYREWLPKYGAAAQAISNNGRWVVGGNDRMGFLLDLTKDDMVEFPTAELYDVADNGIAVGSDHSENPDGDAAMLLGDKFVKIDLSNLVSNYAMSCATGITPDANFVVGWFWEYDESSYYAQQYGMVIPFYYDVLKDRVAIPEVGERPYNEAFATGIKAVAPDRSMLGYEQSLGIHSIIWEDVNAPFEYVHFNYNEDFEPTFSMGDTQNLLSQTGKYVYGKAVDYTVGEIPSPAIYNRETDEITTFTGGSVTAMSDDGIVFINDAPSYIGTTTYVIDVNKGEPYEWSTLEDWLIDEHSVDVAAFLPSTNTIEADNLVLEGVITIAVSEDGRKIVGITNTNAGWLTYVIDLDGMPAE